MVYRPAKFKEEEYQGILEGMAVPERFHNVTYEKIQEGNLKKNVKKFRDRERPVIKNGYSLLLWGVNDVGKTSAAVVLLKVFRQLGHYGFFIRAEEYVSQVIKDEMFKGLTVKEHCKTIALLVLDELGKEPESASSLGGGERMLEGLIKWRSSKELSTIITTNMSTEEMSKRYGESFIRMMKEIYIFVEAGGKSMRKSKMEEMYEVFSDNWIDKDFKTRPHSQSKVEDEGGIF